MPSACPVCRTAVRGDEARCPSCGRDLVRVAPEGLDRLASAADGPLDRCPRCGSNAPLIGFFDQSATTIVAATLSLFGLRPGRLYRRAHEAERVCAACGEDRSFSSPTPPEVARARRTLSRNRTRAAFQWAAGFGLFVSSVLAASLAALVLGGAAAVVVPLVVLGGGGAAWGVLASGASAVDRAAAATERDLLQTEVLRLASERAGRLTVGDVAQGLRLPADRADDLLKGLVDGDAVDIEIGAQGELSYAFRDARRR